jgi:hypothetical protein
MSEVRLYARYENGGHSVVIRGSEFVVERPEGTTIFQSKRQVVQSLTGHSKGRNWTWDRYFRIGKHTPSKVLLAEHATGSVFDLFAPPSPVEIIIKKRAPGIDLAKRGHEVRKLLFAGFGSKIKAANYDPDDVLQEVYKGILVRNNGKCPFDPSKASFGHYVHMVCDCIVSNYHRRMSRQRRVEPISDDGDELAMENAAGSVTAESDDLVAADFATGLNEETPWGDMGPNLASRILPLVREGFGRTEIAEKLGLPKMDISKALGELRREAKYWLKH